MREDRDGACVARAKLAHGGAEALAERPHARAQVAVAVAEAQQDAVEDCGLPLLLLDLPRAPRLAVALAHRLRAEGLADARVLLHVVAVGLQCGVVVADAPRPERLPLHGLAGMDARLRLLYVPDEPPQHGHNRAQRELVAVRQHGAARRLRARPCARMPLRTGAERRYGGCVCCAAAP